MCNEKYISFFDYLKGEVGLFGMIKQGKKNLKGVKFFFDSGYAYSYELLTDDEIELITLEDFIYMGITEHSKNGSSIKFQRMLKNKKEQRMEKKILKYIKANDEFDGIYYEMFLDKPIQIKDTTEEIVRLIIENDKVVAHLLDDKDESSFISFKSLDSEMKKEIYDNIIEK